MRLNPHKVRLNGRWGEIEMNMGKLRTWVERVLDLHKSGNKLSLDFAQVWE